MTYEIITVSSHVPTAPYYCYWEFFKSINRYLKDVTVIGNDKPFKGLGSKPKFLLEHLRSRSVKTSHIIFTDSWDLVFAGSPDDIMETFKSFDAPFVCSAEKNCFPGDLKEQFDILNAPTSYKYLNSGFIVAETAALECILESMELETVPDDYQDAATSQMVHINDQFLFQETFVSQPVKMVLDYEQKLSQTLCNVKIEELDFRHQRIKNIETGKYPLTFHFNGPAKTQGLREPILYKLGL